MDLCLVAERRMGSRVKKRWWEQDGLDVKGMQTAAWEEEQTDGEKESDKLEAETY